MTSNLHIVLYVRVLVLCGRILIAGMKVVVHQTLGKFCQCFFHSDRLLALALGFGRMTTYTGNCSPIISLNPGSPLSYQPSRPEVPGIASRQTRA